jgi:serine/threonine-protein kinase PknK
MTEQRKRIWMEAKARRVGPREPPRALAFAAGRAPRRELKAGAGDSDVAAPGVDNDAVTAPTRVIVADDDVLLREGVASLLDRSGFTVVGQAGDGAELLALCRELVPELVLVDIRMPPDHATEGLDAARAIREELPDVAIVVLSAHVDVAHALAILDGGERSGYLLKSRVTDVDDFLETIRRVAGGGSVVDPELVRELVGARHREDPLGDLSPREREVLALMAEGRSNAGIARTLWVAEGTVEKHVHSILSKLPIAASDGNHRRVLAVVKFLESRQQGSLG